MSWSTRYIGIPFRDQGRDATGCDCWGLVCLVYSQELGLDLPAYSGAYACVHEQREIAALVNRAEACGPWQPQAAPRAFDLLLFRTGRWRAHIALAIDAHHMLHAAAGDCAKIERRDGPRWARRAAGIFRHEARP